MRSWTRSSTISPRCAALVASALLTAPHAGAQDDVVRITGSRLPLSDVLPGQQVRILEPSGASLPDAVRAAPELHVDQPGAPAGFGSLYLRGADPNHAVILLDGVKLNDPTNARGGGFDFGALDPRALERIEVLPGASSAVYGADAMAGVVNILTAPPRGTGPHITGGIGGLGYRQLGAGYDGSKVRILGSAVEDGGREDLGSKRIRSVTLRAPQLAMHAWRHDSAAFPEDSGGPRFAERRELERRETDSLAASLQAFSQAALRVQLGLLHHEADTSSPGVAPGVRDPFGVPPSESQARFTRGSATGSAQFGAALVGIEYQREDGTLDSMLFFDPSAVPANFALERDTRSIFGEARVFYGPAVTAHGGVRIDDVEGHRAQTSALVSLRYRFVGLSLGTGFKPPSFFALGHPLVGNPALAPEESESAQLSVATSDTARVRSRAAAFRTNYSNLIDFDPGPPPRLVNRRSVRIEGLQYDAAATLLPGIHATLGAARLYYELPEGADPLRSRPRSKVSAGMSAALSETVSVQLKASRVGRVFDSSIPTGGRYLESYFVLDAGISYRAGKHEALLALDNVFDRDYEQFIGFPSPGRRLRIQASVGF